MTDKQIKELEEEIRLLERLNMKENECIRLLEENIRLKHKIDLLVLQAIMKNSIQE